MLGILLAEIGEGVDRVARLGHAKLHIAGPEVIVIGNRQLHHPKSVKLVNQGLLLLEWILRTHDKPDLIEIRPVVERICDNQVPNVNRIEAPKVQPDLHFYFAKNPDTNATASAEARSNSSLKMLTSNWGSKVISNLAL